MAVSWGQVLLACKFVPIVKEAALNARRVVAVCIESSLRKNKNKTISSQIYFLFENL